MKNRILKASKFTKKQKKKTIVLYHSELARADCNTSSRYFSASAYCLFLSSIAKAAKALSWTIPINRKLRDLIGDALSESETENMVSGSANIDSLEELLEKLVEKLNMERKLSAQTREAELENQKLQTEISSLKDKLEQKAAIEEQIFTIDGKIRKLQDLVGDALSESETENLVSCSANIDSLEELLRKLIENHAKLSSMKPAYGVVGDGLHSQKGDATVHEERSCRSLD